MLGNPALATAAGGRADHRRNRRRGHTQCGHLLPASSVEEKHAELDDGAAGCDRGPATHRLLRPGHNGSDRAGLHHPTHRVVCLPIQAAVAAGPSPRWPAAGRAGVAPSAPRSY